MRLAAIGSNCIGYYKNLDGGKPFPGGSPVNMAVYTIRLGGTTSYTGPVENDEYGRMMWEAMLCEEGSLCFDGKHFHQYGIVRCDRLVDTLGAGDSYISGFLFGLTEGLSIEDCVHQGAANSTQTLKYFGAR